MTYRTRRRRDTPDDSKDSCALIEAHLTGLACKLILASRALAGSLCSDGDNFQSAEGRAWMIRVVRLLGYAWLIITVVFILGLLGIAWMDMGFDAMVESLSLQFILIMAGAFLPGLIMVFFEMKEESVEDKEDRENRK